MEEEESDSDRDESMDDEDYSDDLGFEDDDDDDKSDTERPFAGKLFNLRLFQAVHSIQLKFSILHSLKTWFLVALITAKIPYKTYLYFGCCSALERCMELLW